MEPYKYADGSVRISTYDELVRALHAAAMLELSTLPPYITAWASIKNRQSSQVATLIHEVFGNEMGHFALVANIVNAIGAHPELNNPSILPVYPGPLAGGVLPELTASLGSLSKDRIAKVFMAIEEPNFKPFIYSADLNTPAQVPNPAYHCPTIGDFYERIKDGLSFVDAYYKTQGKQLFAESTLQYTRQKMGIFPVKDLVSAHEAINIIIDQGEGNGRKDPFSTDGTPSHYYKFWEIYAEQEITPFIRPDDNRGVYAFNPEKAIPFPSENEIYQLHVRSDPAHENLTQQEQVVNEAYSRMLDKLHEAFNSPDEKTLLSTMDEAFSFMVKLASEITTLFTHPEPGKPIYCPSFLYVPQSANR